MWPERIELLEVKGFKTFANATVDVKPCNILIGGNGAGKSSLLSLFKMLRALGHGELQVHVGKAGGANDVLHRAVPATKLLEVGLQLTTMTGRSRYRLLAERTDDDSLLIRAENADRFDTNGQPCGSEMHQRPARESAWAEPALRCSEHRLFTSVRVYHFAETALAAPASFECDVDENQELREDGGNLAAFLHGLQHRHPTAYRRIVDTVSMALGGFGGFVLLPSRLNPQRIRLRWRMKGMQGDFGAHQLSDGTLRFVLLATLLHQPPETLPKIVAIDEPELGLHPAALDLAASLVRVASQHCQVFVATQSAALVDYFNPQDVIVAHRRDGESVLERLTSDALADWLSEYTLGELWEKNVFGGGPFR